MSTAFVAGNSWRHPGRYVGGWRTRVYARASIVSLLLLFQRFGLPPLFGNNLS
jgi:hypothetical protein